MKWYWTVLLVCWFLFVLLLGKRQVQTVAAHHIRKQKKEILAVEAFAKQFINKECIIYTLVANDGSIQGVIREVGDGGVLLEDKRGQKQLINLEYVTRIREFPRNKDGKKKSVITD